LGRQKIKQIKRRLLKNENKKVILSCGLGDSSPLACTWAVSSNLARVHMGWYFKNKIDKIRTR
jgi:hypothetical protein